MDDVILKLLTYFLVGLANLGIGYLITYLRKHKIIKQLKANKELVRLVVKSVQEAYHMLDGEERFKIAKDRLTKLANEKGLKISENELEVMIDAVVLESKKIFKDAWENNESK